MFWAEQTAVLERVAAGDPLAEILADIIGMIEKQASDMMCSLLLVDEAQAVIRHGAAPSLPTDFVRYLDGQRIGPTAGSCGAAVFRKERVIVEDIATHPYWDGYREMALSFGLRACWSTPILSTDRRVIGTFAMYYRTTRGPSRHELVWVDAATHLAAIAIGNARAMASLRRSEARSRSLARLYAMSNAINEAFVHERDGARLYELACRIAVDHNMARLAWIGLVDATTQHIVPVAHAGVATEYVAAIKLDLADDRMNQGPAARALRSGLPSVSNEIANDATFFWKDAAHAHRLRSCAVLPMRSRGRTVGVLAIYAEHEGAFGDEELAVLSTLADDIAFAVDSARTEAALRRSEEQLRAVIEHAPDVAIQWYDEAGRLIFFNQASGALFGWTEAGALGKSVAELGLHGAVDQAQFAALWSEVTAGNHVAPAELAFRRADGSSGALLATVFRIPISDTAYSYVCMDVDLTERRRTEAAVRAGEQLRALIYDCVADAVFYLAVVGDGEYRFESVNRAFFEATGLRESEVIGRRVDDVIPAPSLALVKSKYAEAVTLRAKVAWQEVTRYRTGVKYGQVTVCPIIDASGRCTHLVGTVHDDTARHETELERRQIEGQLHQAQRLQALGTLAGGIAHDFNNILTAIHCNLDLTLQDIGPQHAATESVGEVKRAATRASDLVRQILMFSRQAEPRRELLALRPVVEEALKLLRAALRNTVLFRTAFGDDAPRIDGDSTQIHQVVMNLVTNAAHALGEGGGTIDVALDACVIGPEARTDVPELADGVYARLTVSDDGCGMSADTMRRIFEPFFTTRAIGDGTGLGLSVVHGIIKSHHGAVAVRSELGKGTTFELLFPASKAALARSAPPTATPEPRARRVLFVDDDEALVFLARRAFSRLGHQIAGYTSSREALREYERHPGDFDIVVTDVAMPDLDGPSLVKALRRISSDVKIVMTSSCIRPEHVEIARELGIDRVFEKPQSLDDLAQLVVPLLSK